MPRSKPLRRCSHGRRELAESFGSDPERYDRTRPRYTPTTCFETFPFPRPTDTQRDAIAQAARDLDRLRTGWLNPPGLSDTDLARRTLTNLYNARPTWLAQAHERLDDAVLAAYGWPPDIDREDLLARLLALNLARAAGEATAD